MKWHKSRDIESYNFDIESFLKLFNSKIHRDFKSKFKMMVWSSTVFDRVCALILKLSKSMCCHKVYLCFTHLNVELDEMLRITEQYDDTGFVE